MYNLTLKTPPAIEPVTVSEVMEFGRITADDLATYSNMERLIKSARQKAESYQNRSLVTQKWELTLDNYPRLPLEFPNPPLVSVQSVVITDIDGTVTSMTMTDFTIDTSGVKGRIDLKYGCTWPNVTPETAGIKINYTAGYGNPESVPDDTKTAIAIAALHRFDDPFGDIPQAFYRLLDSNRIQPV